MSNLLSRFRFQERSTFPQMSLADYFTMVFNQHQYAARVRFMGGKGIEQYFGGRQVVGRTDREDRVLHGVTRQRANRFATVFGSMKLWQRVPPKRGQVRRLPQGEQSSPQLTAR